MAYFLLSVLGALAYNLPLLILGIVAVVKASKGKSYFGWLVAGCVVQVPALIGGYQFTFNSDSSTMEVETYIYQLIGFFVLLLIFLIWSSVVKKKANTEVKSFVSEEIEQEVDNRNYKCDSCGFYTSDWYHKCPKCGAAGTMKFFDGTEEAVLSETSNETSKGKNCIKFCPYCGSGLGQDMRFCPNCGMPFEGGKDNPNLANRNLKQSSESASVPIQMKAGRRKKSKRRRRTVPLIVGLFLIAAVIGSSIASSVFRKPFTDNAKAIGKAAQSVVMFSCYDTEGELLATGSGFAAFDKGVFITNYHVIEDAYHISAQMENGDSFDCPAVLAYDAEKDIAILKSDIDIGLTQLPLGSTNDLQKGAKVVAIGSPLGLMNTVSTGIYSGIVTEREIEYLQFSASISSGSSGGALFNENGEVIGVTSASYIEGQNLNLAIPIEQVIALWNGRTKALYSIDKFYNRPEHIKTYNVAKMLSDPESYNLHQFETCKFKGYVSSIEISADIPSRIFLVNDKKQVSGKVYNNSDLDEIKHKRNIGEISAEQYLAILDAARNTDEDAVHSYALQVYLDKAENVDTFTTGDYVCVTGDVHYYPDTIGRVLVLYANELTVLH